MTKDFNDQIPITNKGPGTNVAPPALVIGAWSFVGH
jgi:hypothetical protein